MTASTGDVMVRFLSKLAVDHRLSTPFPEPSPDAGIGWLRWRCWKMELTKGLA